MPKSWICVDANLITRLVIAPDDQPVQQLWRQWQLDRRQLAAPTLLRYEVINALYRYQKQGLLSEDIIRIALKAALTLPIQLHGETDLHRRAIVLAERFALPAAYDAYYLAVAEQLDAELWTADQCLARAVEAALSWVRLVEQ
jgi:predicted nucleic acid-binding protein